MSLHVATVCFCVEGAFGGDACCRVAARPVRRNMGVVGAIFFDTTVWTYDEAGVSPDGN